MRKLDEACKEVVDQIDGAKACGIMDLDTGRLLGLYNSAEHPQTLNEEVAAATRSLFRGPSIGRLRRMVLSHRDLEESTAPPLQEAHITSAQSFHFAKTIRGGKAVMMLVTGKTTNIGMGWAQLKASIPAVERLVLPDRS